MNRSEYFNAALKKCEDAYLNDPTYLPLEWAINQLKKLISIQNENNISVLTSIKIGHIATREMDGYPDKELIHMLCIISNEVDKMIEESNLKMDKKEK